MASASTIRTWSWLHKWSSLVCTAFMLLLCITGLPLIFHHEIDHLLDDEIAVPELPADTPHLSLDRILEIANAVHPERIVQFSSPDDDGRPFWYATLTHSPAPTSDFKSVVVDARTGEILAQPRFDEGIMYVIYKLHVDLFAGFPGMLFLGFMGLLLVVAIISGAVLYAPFMRKLDFGTVRRERSTRLKWLDLHNLLGIVTLVWALVVGATGVINAWADLLIRQWQGQQMSTLLAPFKDQPVIPQAERGPVQQALDAAMKAVPGNTLSFIAFPGTAFSSPRHYTFYLHGNEPLTSRLLQSVIVDARSSEVTAVPPMPWYITALKISQPLHFGDYAGMPMKIIWALLDIITIVVLGSGLYLWLKKRREPQALAEEAGADLAETPAAAGIARRAAPRNLQPEHRNQHQHPELEGR